MKFPLIERIKWYRAVSRQDILEDIRKYDFEENKKGQLPEGERLQVISVWVLMIFTPSVVHSLFKGVQALEWGKYGISDDLKEWLADIREGRIAGMRCLNVVSESISNKYLASHVSELPSGVDTAFAVFTSITPSLTALSMQFNFDIESAESLEQLLDTDYQTEFRRINQNKTYDLLKYLLFGNKHSFGRSSFHTPQDLRIESARQQLSSLEERCIHWMNKWFPGVFNATQKSSPPTAMMFVTENVEPMSNEADKTTALNGFGINQNSIVWRSDEWESVRICVPRVWDSFKNRLVFACRRDDASSDQSEYLNPESNSVISEGAKHHVSGIMTRWGINCLLNNYHQTLSSMRDITGNSKKKRLIRETKEIRKLSMTRLYDMKACTQEIVALVESSEYKRRILNIHYMKDSDKQGKIDLLDEWKTRQRNLSKRIQFEVSLLQDTLMLKSTLSQLITSVRIQRVLLVFTIASVAIAVTAAYFAYQSVPQ